MIFFTRELFNGYQPGSGWIRRAERTWARNASIYSKYLEVISPLLPTSVKKLCKSGLHDGVITSVRQNGSQLTIVVDLANALSGLGRGIVTLTFEDVAGKVSTSGLEGQWWLYEEVHLAPRNRFLLGVLLEDDELAIEASKLKITSTRTGRRRGRKGA